MRKCSLFNLAFDAFSQSEAVDFILTCAKFRQKGLVVTPNADHIVLLNSDVVMRDIYSVALAVLADGMPLVWLSRLIGQDALSERVTGSDLLPAVCESAARSGTRMFLLGGPPGVAHEASVRLSGKYPGLEIVGCYCPPFGFEFDPTETERIVNIVNSCAPDILVMGVGTPKQEKWAHQHLAKLEVGPILCIGAAIDFAAGNIRRCPKWLQNLGLEWSWRLATQPRRLWRRYLVRGPVFVKLAIVEFLRARSGLREKPYPSIL